MSVFFTLSTCPSLSVGSSSSLIGRRRPTAQGSKGGLNSVHGLGPMPGSSGLSRLVQLTSTRQPAFADGTQPAGTRIRTNVHPIAASRTVENRSPGRKAQVSAV